MVGQANGLGKVAVEDQAEPPRASQELDLAGVTATRVSFVNCRAGSLALAHARLKDMDLRGLEVGSFSNLEGLSGATLDAQQVTALAPALAAHLGIRIEG